MKLKLTLAAVAAVALASLPALAHHSFAAEYDSSKAVKITGKFVKMDWVNPHSWVWVEVTGADGKTVTWRAETPPPNGLYRQGWTKNSLKPGEEITIQGFLAKDGDNLMWSSSVTNGEGRRIFAGTAEGPGAPGAPKQ
jgi:hypothetical protein